MPRAAFLVISQEKGLSTGPMRTALICYLPFYCKIRESKSPRACSVRHTRALPAQGSGNYLGPLLPVLGTPRLGLWGQLCAGSLLVALTQFWCHFCGLCVMELLLDLLRSKTVTFLSWLLWTVPILSLGQPSLVLAAQTGCSLDRHQGTVLASRTTDRVTNLLSFPRLL